MGQDSRPWETLETRVMMSLVHHYPFNEGSGTTTADLAGLRPGTLMTDADPAAGDQAVVGLAASDTAAGVSWRTVDPSPAGGSYLHFNAEGASTFNNAGGRVDVAPTNALSESFHNELGLSASVSAYIRFTDLDSTEVIGNDTTWQAPAITGNENASWGNDTMLGSITANGNIGIQKSDGARATSSISIKDGSWHLIAVTRDYDTGQARVYIDGRLSNTTNTNAGPVSAFWDAIGALTLVDISGTLIDGYNYMNNVDLDDVRMYNHVLTQGEVSALIPAAQTGPLATTPVITSVVPDAANGRNITVNFTDTNPNEAGFLVERATLLPNGQPGAFVAVGQTGSGTNVSFTDRSITQFGQQFVYRVRAFNPSGEGLNAVSSPVTSSGAGLPAGVGAGYLNSNFWGALARQWGTDPNPEDGATGGNAAQGVGAISLNGTLRDPSNPAGIAVREPDVSTVFTGTDIGGGVQGFNVNWGTGTPHPAIRVDNHSVMMTGKLTFTVEDIDFDGLLNTTDIPVPFEIWSDDDGWVYVNGQLMSTDPGGHGQQAPGNVAPGLLVDEGQTYSWDIVALSAEQGGGSGIGVKWMAPGSGAFAYIPMANMSVVPTAPQASTLVPTGTNSAHQVSFTITDTTTSEQRFELWRKVAGTPDSAYIKVNEAGINAPFINDASAQPGTTYDYILLGYNFVSGYTPLAAAIANKVTQTTAAAEPAMQGLNVQYFNDDFWGLGENRPLPANGNLFVGLGGDGAIGADEFVVGVNPQQNYGDDNHDPAILPGGSPSPLIRDNSHSTLWTGKLIINPGEEGEYYILGFGDDDTHVIVNNVITSSDPNGHGARNPIPGSTGGQPTTNGGFVNPINLTAGEHDITILQSEQGGGSGIFLRWLKPGQTTTDVPTDVPVEQLSTATSAPVAPGAPTYDQVTGTTARATSTGTGTNELKNVLVLATDAGFTQNVRRVPVGILVTTGAANNPSQLTVSGLTPNTTYFTKLVSMNNVGSADSAVTQFTTAAGGGLAPAAPSNVFVRPQTANMNVITFNDNSSNETGFVIQRRVAGGTFATVAEVGPGINTYTDTLDPVAFPAGTQIEYQVLATNNGVNSDPGAYRAAGTGNVLLGGPGGTGLQMRIWTTLVGDGATLNPDQVLNNVLARIAEPARAGDGTALAPAVDKVDALIPNNWGTGVPAIEDRDADTFAIEWVGWIVAEETKAYDFSIITDDGGRLFLDDVEVIDGNWRDQGDTEAFSEPVQLTAGQKVKVRFQMYEQGGGASARLRWNGASNNAREDIPAVFMFPDAGTVDPNNAIANVPNRPVSATEVFAAPVTDVNTAGFINVRWQDNAFGEAGYDIQRADNAQFTGATLVSQSVDASDPQNPIITELVGPGRDLFVDDGGYLTTGTNTLDPTKTYYYRIKPRGTPDSAYVVAGSAQPFGSAYNNETGLYETVNLEQAGTDLTLTNFPSTEMVTVNGRATVTAEKSIKLTHNQNDRWGSAWLNRAFDIDTDFEVTTDVRMGESNGADGMAFVIQNSLPGAPVTRSQLRQLGGGGGAIGYAGMQNSVAVIFDFHDALDTLGVYANGATPPGGVLANYGASIRTGPENIQEPNGSFNLRDTANLTPGTAAINLDGGTRFRLTATYDDQGVDADGDGVPSAADTGLLTISLSTAAAPETILFKASYNIDLATFVGTDTALMGWTAGTGGLNARQEVYNFKYDGPIDSGTTAVVTEVFVRGSAWQQADANPATTTFMEYLEAKGLGDDVYGYRLFANGAPTTGPVNNPEQILPWINMDEIVIRYDQAPGAGVPTPGTLTVSGQRNGAYTVTSVTPVAGDPTAFVLRLGKPLGGGDPVTGLAPTTSENGDRISLSVPNGAPGNTNFSLRMNVLQGDVDHLNETVHNVLARDYAEVKKRFFKNSSSVPSNPDTDYTPFHDVDGNGQILARDYAEVKKRFFQNLPAVAAAAGESLFADDRVAEEVLA